MKNEKSENNINEKRLSAIIGKGYEAFWQDHSRYIAVKGGKASKKSTTVALRFLYLLMRYPQSNLLVLRRVAETNRFSTLEQMKKAAAMLGVEHLFSVTLNPMEMTYRPTGQKILFRGLDDAQKLASLTLSTGALCWVWLEEAFEVESEAEFDRLDLSVPRGQMPEGLFKQTVLTFNPWDANHWLKGRFFDSPDDETKHTYTFTYLQNEWLDAADLAVYERMKRENPMAYRVAGLGEWGVPGGQIFTRFRQGPPTEDMVSGLDPASGRTVTAFAKAENWRLCVGLDFGYAK